MDANTEFDYNATIENMMAKYQLTKDQAIIIKKQWFSDVEKQFYAYVAGKNTLRIFPSNVDIRFQFKNDELENLLSYPTLSDSNGLIHSVSFFNLQFLLALFYIQTMVKCMSIELFKIEDYNKAIENAKKELFYDTAGFHYNFSNDEIYIILENFLDNNV
jgi:hypothetical protein